MANEAGSLSLMSVTPVKAWLTETGEGWEQGRRHKKIARWAGQETISRPHSEGHVGGWASPSEKRILLKDIAAWWPILLRCGMLNSPSVRLRMLGTSGLMTAASISILLCELYLHNVYSIEKRKHTNVPTSFNPHSFPSSLPPTLSSSAQCPSRTVCYEYFR